MNPDVAAIVTFAAIGLVIFVLGLLLVGRQRNDTSVARPLAFGRLTHGLAGMLPLHFERIEGLKSDLLRAGYYHREAHQEYLAIRNLLVVGTALLTVAMMVAAEPSSNLTMPIFITGSIVSVVLFSAPRLILQIQAANRLKRIQHGLPDALDMLTMTMTGGLPLQQALGHVQREIYSTYPDLACELAILGRHTETGSLDQALQQFSSRIDIPDVQALTALVSQTERLGSNVTRAFRDYSDGVRRGQRHRVEERGNRASIAMILPIVLCLAPPIYILLLGPALLELRNFVVEGNTSGGVLQPDISSLEQVRQEAGN